jgi:hypothetical protein
MDESIINEDELKVLAYLHEHAKGWGEDFPVSKNQMMAALGWEREQFRKHWSFLAGHGLVGSRTSEVQVPIGFRKIPQTLYWMTVDGEKYMRAIESRPGIGKKLTVTVVSELWGMGKGVAAQAAFSLFKEFAKSHGIVIP